MQERYRLVILKVLALTGVIAFIYPLILVARVALFECGWNLPNQLFDVLIAALGVLCSCLSEKNNKNKAVKILIIVIFAVIPAIGASIFFKYDIFRVVFEMFCAYIFYIIGIKAYFTEYSSLLSVIIIETGLFLIAASFVLDYWGKLNVGKFIIVYAYIFTVIAMIIRNQSNIDRVFLKMNRQLAGVTKNLRRFNIISVFSMLIITVLLFNLTSIKIFLLVHNILRNYRNSKWTPFDFFEAWSKNS